MVLRDNAISPVFSDMSASLVDQLRQVPGVARVAPEVWKASPRVENRGLFSRAMQAGITGRAEDTITSLLDMPVISGQDIPAHRGLRSAVFPKAMVKGPEGGRFLDDRDIGKPHVVVSTKIARDYPITDRGTKRPRRVGDPLSINGKPFEIVGLYETGSLFLDVVIIMDIGMARQTMDVAEGQVSCFYVETNDPGRNEEISNLIERELPGTDARGMSEIMQNFGSLMNQLDQFLLMTVSLALVVGVVGIVNTMLMSTTERFAEFGILRTNGWSRSNVLTLVTAESAYLGLLSGLAGCALAFLGSFIANRFLADSGLRLSITPYLLSLGIGLSVAMGMLGGLYPAWRASRLVPMDAIRLGSR
jgi:putative ABC transport system permease protein